MTLYSNFTYFLDDPEAGDQFEQEDHRKVDESVGWLESMRDGKVASDPKLLREAQELCAIFTKSLETSS